MTTDHDEYAIDEAVNGERASNGGASSSSLAKTARSPRSALDSAPRLLSGRAGSIEVVFVAHTPIGAEMSPEAQSGMHDGFDAAEIEFETDVLTRYSDIDQIWHFHRRDGQIAHELNAVADGLVDNDADVNIVIVVGSAVHAYHHVVG